LIGDSGLKRPSGGIVAVDEKAAQIIYNGVVARMGEIRNRQ
jgi:hypothetical protein